MKESPTSSATSKNEQCDRAVVRLWQTSDERSQHHRPPPPSSTHLAVALALPGSGLGTGHWLHFALVATERAATPRHGHFWFRPKPKTEVHRGDLATVVRVGCRSGVSSTSSSEAPRRLSRCQGPCRAILLDYRIAPLECLRENPFGSWCLAAFRKRNGDR